jgi:hypothetical protein
MLAQLTQLPSLLHAKVKLFVPLLQCLVSLYAHYGLVAFLSSHSSVAEDYILLGYRVTPLGNGKSRHFETNRQG